MASSRECCPTSLAARRCFSFRLCSNHSSVNTFWFVSLRILLRLNLNFPIFSFHPHHVSSRSCPLLRRVLRDLFSIAGTVGHRLRVSYVLRTNFGHRVCRRRLANNCWNVQLISTATLLHHDIRHRLLNAGLQIFAVVYRIAGSVFVSSVVCTRLLVENFVCLIFFFLSKPVEVVWCWKARARDGKVFV